MQVKLQVFSKHGYLGPEIEFDIWYVSELTSKLMKELDALPDEYEGVKTSEWDRITIEIIRKD